MDEMWKPVPYEPFDKAYSVSNLGRVRPNVPSRYSKNRAEVLDPSPSPRGYLHVSLYAEGKSRSCFIHRMVALAFIGPPPFPTAIVCHADDCKTNNQAGNLSWGTNKSNAATREAIGKSSRGEGNGHAKLTEEDVREIRHLRYADGGMAQQQLADRFGVSQRTVSKILSGQLWKHSHT